MPSRFSYYRQQLSFTDALLFYRYVKGKKERTIKFSFLKQPVTLRANPCDQEMFSQIFLERQYHIYYPFSPETIIDLGANVGLGAVFFSNHFPEAKIISLEPEAGNYSMARINTAAYPNIQLIQGAVWHRPGEVEVVDQGHGEAAFMVAESVTGPGHKKLHAIRSYTIPELASMLNAETIDLVKMDVEGAEKEIFEHDVSGWLPRTKMLIVETHDRYRPGSSKALFSVMANQDFSLELSGENLVFYNNKLVDFDPFQPGK